MNLNEKTVQMHHEKLSSTLMESRDSKKEFNRKRIHRALLLPAATCLLLMVAIYVTIQGTGLSAPHISLGNPKL